MPICICILCLLYAYRYVYTCICMSQSAIGNYLSLQVCRTPERDPTSEHEAQYNNLIVYYTKNIVEYNTMQYNIVSYTKERITEYNIVQYNPNKHDRASSRPRTRPRSGPRSTRCPCTRARPRRTTCRRPGTCLGRPAYCRALYDHEYHFEVTELAEAKGLGTSN